jgi:hypothetical protein
LAIAAHALATNATLVTANLAHMTRVPGLQIEDWADRGVEVDRAPVTSRAVVSVGYDTVRQILELEFVDGDVYQYYDVPQTTHNALLNAPSIGQFVNTDVKGRFRYTKL